MKCCDIHSGLLRHKVSLQRESVTADDYGGHLKTWEEYASVWAYVNPRHAREIYTGEKLEHIVIHDIIIRYRQGVESRDRVRLSSDRVFRIEGVLNIEEKNEWLQLVCEEGKVDTDEA